MLSKNEPEMNEHVKAMWAGQSNVLVAVRVRPLMKHDQVKKGCVRVLDTSVVVIMDPAAGDKYDILRANRSREKQYAFDYVFETNSTQEHTYLNTAKFLIHGVLDGFNATVFAYGQTGSGKTHTMIGSESEPGIMVRVMDDLFTQTQMQSKAIGVLYKVSVSFLEVYNENIRDLLSDTEEYLDLREDPIKGPVVASITEIEAISGQEIMSLLHQGNSKRSQAATAANEVSSRSHAVLQVVVESRDKAPGTVANIKVGKLSLVDLAGSERAANTKNVGARLVEGANINRSLLALGNCINALGEKGNKGNFVPYRDSKLTRLLKDSLGGNCRTVMIACISSAESSFEETLNTLKYANRAKNIKTNVQRNVLNVNYHISEYVALINNLRGEIQVLKSQIAVPSSGVGLDGRVNSSHLTKFGGIEVNKSYTPLRTNSPPSLNAGQKSPLPGRVAPSTPFQALRESMRSATSVTGEGRELVNNMRERIVENFQERMQLRRSLIELEDQNVQNSIEVSKRQLIVVQWAETHGSVYKQGRDPNLVEGLTKADFAADIITNGDPEIVEAWQECEQLRKAIMKNNGMKKNIAKRLRHNEKEAENFRDELGDKITGEDRRELMELQYQVGRLELENMELEQHRIVHESILKGKDLEIQKLKLQLAVRDKLITRQQNVLVENNLDGLVGYHQLALMEQTLMGDSEFAKAMVPPSPPRNMMEMQQHTTTTTTNTSSTGAFMKVNKNNNSNIATGIADTEANVQDIIGKKKTTNNNNNNNNKPRNNNNKDIVPRLKIVEPPSRKEDSEGGVLDSSDEDELQDEYSIPLSERETALTARDRDLIEKGDWSEVCIHTELSDNDYSLLGVRGVEGVMISSFQQQQPQQQQQGGGASNSSKVAGSNTIHGPRGGRQFRSSFAANATNNNTSGSNAAAAMEDHGTSSKSLQHQQHPHRGFKIHPNGFQVEDSDEDSINGGGGGNHHSGKQQQVQYSIATNNNNNNNYNKKSPRSGNKNSNDRLDPIPLPYNTEIEAGILSGKKYEYQAPNKAAYNISSNYNNNNNIQTNSSNNSYKKDMKSYGAKDVDNGANNNNSNIAIYPTLPTSEERFKKEAQSKYNNSNNSNNSNNGMNKNNIRKSYNSQESLDAITDDIMNPTMLAFNENSNEDLNSIINNQYNVRPKVISIQQNRQNAALSRLKAQGLVIPSSFNSNNSNNNNNSNDNNNEFSLNILGSGLGGGGANAEGAIISRPANKNKNNNARKLLSKPQQTPLDFGGLSIDGVGSAQNGSQDDYLYPNPNLVAGNRMKSLPNLSKQQQQNALEQLQQQQQQLQVAVAGPVSARGVNNERN